MPMWTSTGSGNLEKARSSPEAAVEAEPEADADADAGGEDDAEADDEGAFVSFVD